MATEIDLEFFENVIAYNVLKNETYLCSVIDHLHSEYFDNKDVAAVVDVIISFYNERDAVPNTSELKSRLTTKELKRSFVNVVNSFKTLDTSYNTEELISNTEHYLRQKAVYNAVLQAADNINTQSVSPAETLECFEKACNINLVNDFGIDIVNDVDEFIERISEEHRFISTGYQWLDKMLGGGWLKSGKALYIFSAATNVGKSIMLSNLASNLMTQDKTAVVFTLEMSEEMYGKRIASNLTSIPINSLRENSDILKDNIDSIHDDNERAHLFVKEFPTKGATVRNLESYTKKLIDKRKIKPDVIFVDYLNLLSPTISTGNTYLDIKSIAEELRRLSYKFGGIPIVSATQLNRSAYDEINPGIETTSESMGLSHTTDAQISLWASEEDREMGLLHAGMQKSRFGPKTGKNGTFNIDWDTLKLTESNDSVFEGQELESAHSILESLE